MSLDLVPNRIYSQYRDKPKLVKWMDIAREQGTSIDDAFEKISLSWDIDSSEGVQLDVIGRIVGVNRDFINKIPLEPVQFGRSPYQFGGKKSFFSAGSVAADAKMSDDLFRILIKAKILKNNRSATIEEIIEQMSLLLGIDFIRINNAEDMTFSIEFAGDITPLQRYALLNESIVQIPQGVRFDGFTELRNLVQFGDANHMFGRASTQFTPVGV